MMKSSYKISGSVLALGAAGALPVNAQDALSGFTLEVKGGYGLSDSRLSDKLGANDAPSELEDKLGDIDGVDGFFGGIRATKAIDEWRDFGFGLNGTYLSGETSNSEEDKLGGFTVKPSERFTALTLDADMGFRGTFNQIDVRGFAGIRAARIESKYQHDFVLEDKLGDVVDEASFDKVGEFQGVGPRVGAQASQRFSNSNLGWFAGASGSALYGTHKLTFQIEGDGSPSESQSESESGTVYSLDAELGVNYYLQNNSKISVGYRAEKYWNLMTDEYDELDEINDRLVHGAFIGYTTQF